MGNCEPIDALLPSNQHAGMPLELTRQQISYPQEQHPLGFFRYSHLRSNLRLADLFNIQSAPHTKEDLDEIKLFLINNMQGPFYFGETDHEELALIIIDPRDVQKFLNEYPNWEEDKTASIANSATLDFWLKRAYSPR
ncbi:MAG TPA: hypothetical protein PLK94_05245 [Alphaproteobacteria bacterium]|nr:hypothetical protein [Alphaproteobacteria bacterium]HOO50679.1 hypothetical protein [Alphaproteobacteria bacterium]